MLKYIIKLKCFFENENSYHNVKMLNESEIITLLMKNHSYFDSLENRSLYSEEELQHIVVQLKKLEEKYFKRIMELHNDPDEKSEKITGRKVIEHAHTQLTFYLQKPIEVSKKKQPCNYGGLVLIVWLGILMFIVLCR